MDIKSLKKLNINELGDKTFLSKNCTKYVTKTNAVKVGFGTLDNLRAILTPTFAPYSSCLLISDNLTKDKTSRLTEKKLAQLGYVVYTHYINFDKEITPLVLDKIDIQESVRFIVGVGGKVIDNAVKYLGKKLSLKSVFIPTNVDVVATFSSFYTIKADVLLEQFSSCAHKIIVSDKNLVAGESDREIARAYGSIASGLVSLFDYKFSQVIYKEEFSLDIYNLSIEIIDDATSTLVNSNMTKKERAYYLHEQSLRLSFVMSLIESESKKGKNSKSYNPLFCGSQTQVGNTIELLFDYEFRDKRLDGEREFICSQSIMELYRSVLFKTNNFFVPPPNNIYRAEIIEEYLGIKSNESQKHIRAVLDNTLYSILQYRYREYIEELQKEFIRIKNSFERCLRVFKRLYDDDGYGLLNYIESSDISVALSLGSDLFCGKTFLGYIKDIGLLDDLI